MDILLTIIGLVWGILNIILFFKLWGACNDIRRIADRYDPDGKVKREVERERLRQDRGW